jgi:hypothetical protein
LEIKKLELQFGFELKPKLQLEFFSTMAKQLLASTIVQMWQKIKNLSCNSGFFQPWPNNFRHQKLLGCGQKIKNPNYNSNSISA